MKDQENPIQILEELSEIAAKKRKGKSLKYDKRDFYEQYDEREKRAGIRI